MKSIKLRGNNGEQVAGEIYINSEDASCELAADAGIFGDDTEVGGTIFEDGTVLTTVTLRCGNSVVLSSEPTAFYIALPPQTFKSGITIEIADAYGATGTKSTYKEIEIKRNTILPMAAFEVEMEDIAEQKVPADTEIWYTNGSTSNATAPHSLEAFGANIVSNTYDAEKSCWVIKFDNPVTSIGERAFDGCSGLTSVIIPGSVVLIGDGAFSACVGLTSITIPNSVTSLGYRAFAGCAGLESVNIPNGVTSIGEAAFENCIRLTSVIISNSVLSIGHGAFSNCKWLKSVVIPNSVISIEAYAFSGCGELKNITIPNSVQLIGRFAFERCISLDSITIGDGVKSIEGGAFQDCWLETVYCKSKEPPTRGLELSSTQGVGIFENYIFPDMKIYVPNTSVDKYKSDEYWSEYESNIEGYEF